MNDDAVRILVLTDSLGVGGTERQLVELLKGLQRSGRYAAVLGVLDHGGGLEAQAAAHATEVLRIRRPTRFDATPALALIQQTRRSGARLIHAVGWMSGLAGLIAARLLRLPILNGSLRSVPPVLDTRGRISRRCALFSNAIVANAPAALRALELDRHPRARVIANGIDLARFDGIAAEDSGVAQVCMIANFSRYKDHAALIRAVPSILNALPHARLTLVGRDAGTLTAARQLADELGVSGAVCFVTDGRAPEPIIAASAVCVLSSPSEGMSNAVMEYMALRKPVVASACDGNAALVRDGESGFLVPPGAAEPLAARVIELLRDGARARRMGAAGRQRIEDDYSLPRMVAEYEALYDRLRASR